MKKPEITTLETNLPPIFDRRSNLSVDEEWVVVGENELMPQGDMIEEYLYGEAEALAPGRSPDTLGHLEGALSRIDKPRTPEPPPDSRIPVGSAISLEAGRAGSPGELRPPPGGGNIVPPPDCYAFYLPWHYFSVQTWGVYLLVEGIETFGKTVEMTAQGGLTTGEARKVARAFLFHHEAYHNAVETFAIRLEVSHRVPCYRIGLERLYRSGFAHCRVHEEGLATAYAARKVLGQVFADIKDLKIRKAKRQIAYRTLEVLIAGMPREYASALDLLPKTRKFDQGEREFQESAHAQCLPSIPRVKPDIWASALHSMGPSLQRNKSFSYVIRRTHPALRNALSVRYLSVKRRQFMQRLGEVVGGGEVGGGKHPKWQAPSGKKVPVPTGTDLKPYTCIQILKQLGLTQGLNEFMTRGA